MALFGIVVLAVLAGGGLTGYGIVQWIKMNRAAGRRDARLVAETDGKPVSLTSDDRPTPNGELRRPEVLDPPPSAPAAQSKEIAARSEKDEPPTPTLPGLPVLERPKLLLPAVVEPPALSKEPAPPAGKEEPPPNASLPPLDKERPAAGEKPPPKDPPPAKPPAPLTPEASPGGEAPDGIVVMRRGDWSDEDLRKQLLTAPEIGLDQTTAEVMYAPLLGLQRKGLSPSSLQADLGPRFLRVLAVQLKRPDWTDLPWQPGVDCQLGKEAAERLHVLSTNLRSDLQKSVPVGDIRPDPDKLRAILFEGGSDSRGVNSEGPKPSEWRQPGAIPAFMQMLQTENTPIRLLLVELLSGIEGKEASVALVQRALFDLSPQVREKAIQALAGRPASEYRQALMVGFRHPWPPVADHAAEAVLALKDRGSLAALIDLLNEPDPKLPFLVKDKDKEVLSTRELVRINHLSNCMVCHAPSLSKEDLVRGLVPAPSEEPPPAYYGGAAGLFVRADTTYLRQDFSVIQPVANAGKWPGDERFDYLTRTRPLTKAEQSRYLQMQVQKPKPGLSEQREALLATLRGLAGKDPGSSYEAWKPLKLEAIKEGTKE